MVSYNAMTSGCGNLEEAFTVFSKQHNRDVVSYNTRIFGYLQNNKGFLALKSLSSRCVQLVDLIDTMQMLWQLDMEKLCSNEAMKLDLDTIAGYFADVKHVC